MNSDSELIREEKETPDTHGETHVKTSERNPAIPHVSSVPSSPPPKTHCEITCKPEKNVWDHIKTGAEILGVVLLAAYTWYTIKMYCANKEAADAAQSAAKAATNSVILQQSNSQIDQRAWVSVSDVKFVPRGDEFYVSIVLVNTGKTPAKDFTVRDAGELVPNGKIAKSQESPQPGKGIIAPNGTFHTTLSANGYYSVHLGTLIVHGRIDYRDVFGDAHWTKFCYYWVPENNGKNGGFAPCDEGNSIDDFHSPNLIK